MPLAQKPWRRSQVEVRPRPCHGQQSVDVFFPGLGPRNHLTIDRLLARQVNLTEQPPNRWMKPPQSSHQFFGDREHPIPPAHVQQFVAEDGFANPRVQIGKSGGQQDHRLERTKSDRACDLTRKQQCSALATIQQPGTPPVLSQPPKTSRQPGRTPHNPGQD